MRTTLEVLPISLAYLVKISTDFSYGEGSIYFYKMLFEEEVDTGSQVVMDFNEVFKITIIYLHDSKFDQYFECPKVYQLIHRSITVNSVFTSHDNNSFAKTDGLIKKFSDFDKFLFIKRG